jgi:hypothetical protein
MVAPRARSSNAFGEIGRTIRDHLGACLVLAAPYAVFIGLGSGLSKAVTLDVGPSAVAVSEVAVTGIVVFIALAAFVVLSALVLPPTLGGLSLVGSAQVYGDAVDAGGIRRQAIDHAVDTIGAAVLAALVLAAAPVALGLFAVVVSAVASATAGFAVLIFALAVCAIPEVYVAVRLSLVVPIAVREGLKPTQALRRSWELVHGARVAWLLAIEAAAVAVAAAVFVALSSLGGALHVSGFVKFVVDLIAGTVEAFVAVGMVGVAIGVAYGTLASEPVPAPAEVGAHEVLPEELPPL